MDKKIYLLSAREIAEKVRVKKITAEEVALSCIEKVEQLEDKVKAWAFFDKRILLSQARSLDEKIRKGEFSGKLAGVPIGVKDIFNTQDMPTSMGSLLWQGHTPGNDARVIFNLRQEDAVIAGKTVTAEFAVHEPGPTRNPHDLSRYPGTSSSGSSAAVACGMVPAALGTQTAGSIIRPASYCGVYGFKPTFGLIPRTAVLKTNDTLDQIGWFSRNVSDLETILDLLRVKGPNYPYVYRNIDRKDPSFFTRKKWKIFFVKHPKWEYADEYARKAVASYVKRLSLLKNVSVEEGALPAEFDMAHDVHEKIYNKTLSYYFSEEAEKRHLVSKVLYGLIEEGKRLSVGEYLEALDQQVMLRDSLQRIFNEHDMIVTLSTSGEAPLFLDPVDKPDSCLIWNLCGAPAANVPVFKGPNDLPFGLQVVAGRYMDLCLMNFIKMMEETGLANSVLPVDIIRKHEKKKPGNRRAGFEKKGLRCG
ncbi:MAG: amidase [Candidatus Omnitrophota bacterium]